MRVVEARIYTLQSTIFWILRRGELEDATDKPQYVLSIPFATTLTMRGFLKNISIIIPILYLYYTY